MGSQLYIPKDKSQAETVVQKLVETGKQRRNPQAIRWWIAHWYMRGARNFSNINYTDGTIQISFVDESGFLKFQYEDIISKYQAQLGRLLGLDLSPRVRRKGVSLDGLRKSSIAQVALDAAFPEDKVLKLRQAILPPLLMYGTVGLGLWVEGPDSQGIDVIMPWELLPVPSDVSSPTDVRGIIRRRFVPTKWVKELVTTPGARADAYKEMNKFTVPTGQIPPEVYMKFQAGASFASSSGDAFYVRSKDYPSGGRGGLLGLRKKDKTMMDITEFVEVWTETPDHYLGEYLIFAGGKLLYRKDHTENRIHMPTRVIADVQVGGFWGRSYIDTLIPLNTELEYTIGRVFQNLQEWDYYGILCEPTTAGIPVEAERGKDGLKRLRYEPDYTVPDLKPYNIPPANSGTMAWRVLQLGSDLMDKVANQPKDLMSGKAPGRVDSSAGLGLLYEVSGVPLSPTAKNLSIAVSGCYKALLGLIRNMWSDDKLVDVSHLDDALAGIKFDPGTGEMSLSENAIPHPDEVIVTISSEIPESPQQQKMELTEALQMQIITPTEYRIEVRKRGLHLPVGNEVEWQNYRRAMLENLILFGDGQKPGQAIISDRDMHTIHLMVLDAFMARPEFYLANSIVRDKFAEHREAHMAGLGQLPEGMEAPEEAAELAMAQMGEGGAPGPGGPPMM